MSDALTFSVEQNTAYQERIERLYRAAGCRTQVELAEFLGVRQPAISDAKQRRSIPADWLLTLLRKKRINPDWVLSGNGARHMRPSEDVGEDFCETSQLEPRYRRQRPPSKN